VTAAVRGEKYAFTLEQALRRGEEMSVSLSFSDGAIARRFGLSQSKVKTTLFRCRHLLREFLIKEGYSL